MDYQVSPEVLLIRDTPAARRTEKEKQLLERHASDMYAVFLHKLTGLMLQPDLPKAEADRLRAFLDELLKMREA